MGQDLENGFPVGMEFSQAEHKLLRASVFSIRVSVMCQNKYVSGYIFILQHIAKSYVNIFLYEIYYIFTVVNMY